LRDSLSARSCPPGNTRDGPLEPCPAVISAANYAQWPRLKSPREPFHNVTHLLVRSTGRIAELIASVLVHKPARRCQLSRPWYARCVGGAAARVGRSFTYLWCCPALTERRRKRAR
jgi:hypothetical protein